jgi:hypothetical protein
MDDISGKALVVWMPGVVLQSLMREWGGMMMILLDDEDVDLLKDG